MIENGETGWAQALRAQTDSFTEWLMRGSQSLVDREGGFGVEAPFRDGFEAAIEELRVAEEELRQQSDELAAAQSQVEAERLRYQELFDFSPDAYFLTDADGTILEANQAAIALVGLRHAFVVGKPLAAFVARDQVQHFRTQLGRLQQAQHDSRREWELRVRTRTGRARETAVRVTIAWNRSGQVSGIRWLIRDNTMRKQAEEEAQRLTLELERRVRERTAQLDATARVHQAALTQERTARLATEAALAQLSEVLLPLGAELNQSLAGLRATGRRFPPDAPGADGEQERFDEVEALLVRAALKADEAITLCRTDALPHPEPDGSPSGDLPSNG